MKTIKNDPPICSQNLMAMRDTLDILGGKWKLLIMHYLIVRDHEANTFKKMERDIEGISAKMLSKELKDLEVNLLVKRQVNDTHPVTVSYSVTAYGKTTKDIIFPLVNWGIKHRTMLVSQYAILNDEE